MTFRISDYKIICLIAISLSLFFGALPMDHAASSLGKHGREEAQESDEQPAAKVQKTEHSVDVASHKLRKKIIEHFAKIGKGSFALSADLQIFIKENPNIRDDLGNTLFHYALLFSNRDLLHMLMSNSKTDIAVRNDEGLSLLKLAVQQNDRLVVDYILYKAAEGFERISHEFMLDLYSVLSETVYVMNNPEIIQLLENFVMKNEASQNDVSLLAAAHSMQISTCRQYIKNKVIQQEQYHSQEKQLKTFLDAKKSIIEDSNERLVNCIWDYDGSDLNLDWQNLFTLDEQNMLCSAFSRGIVTFLQRNFMQMYEDFRHENLFIFLIDIDATLEPDIKERLKIIFEQEAYDMLPIDLAQDDVEKLPTELLFYLVFKAIKLSDKEFLKRNLKSKSAYFINKQDHKGNTLLHKAIRSGDMEIIEMILAWLPLLDVVNDKGNTPLHEAVAYGDVKIVEAILTRGPNVNIQNNEGKAPLQEALRFYEENLRYLEIIKLILACRPDLNQPDNKGRTPLQVAIKKGHVDIVNEILASNPDISMCIYDSFGGIKGTILFESVLSGHVEAVRAILHYTFKDENKSSIARSSCYLLFPLEQAIEAGNLEIVQELLAFKPELKKCEFGRLLSIVFRRGRIPLAKAVLDYKQTGAAIEDRDARIALELLNYYPTADPAYVFLNAVIQLQSIDILNEYLELKPEIQVPNEEGMMPVHYAIWCCGSPEMVQIFLDRDPQSINQQDSLQMCTPLHMAISSENINLVKTLLEFRPNLNLQDCNGNTPVHMVLNCYQHAFRYPKAKDKALCILNFLLDSGFPFDVGIKNNQGKTVIDLACDDVTILKILNSICFAVQRL